MNPGNEIQIPEGVTPLFDQLQLLIKNARGVILSGHSNPDGDSVSSIITMAEYLESMGKKFLAVGDEAFPATYSFLKNRKYYTDVKTQEGQLIGYDLLIAVDSGDLERIGKLKEMLVPETVIVNIDHHKVNNGFGILNIVLPGASSIGEILYYFFQHQKFEISKGMAEAIYISLVSDTGSFKYDSMHPEVHQIAADLLKKGVVPSDYIVPLYQNRSPNYLLLLSRALTRLEFFADNRIAIATLLFEDLESAGNDDSEGIVETVGIVGSVSVYILIKEKKKDFFSASLRSKHQVDVASIAMKFGGGGHTRAAGCRTDKMDLTSFKNAIVEQILMQL